MDGFLCRFVCHIFVNQDGSALQFGKMTEGVHQPFPVVPGRTPILFGGRY